MSDEALKLLAPGIAAALTSAESPLGLADLPADDRDRLLLVRDSVAAWIAIADQLPPAEVVDRVLAESAYAVEIGGAGFAQARENLKKVRGLIRRIQNRGYATLGRLADYFAELVAGGDESNAIIDAADAVNLMTVHAAKGLEFPVVFVVNLGKGSGGGRDDIRVVAPPFIDDDQETGAASATLMSPSATLMSPSATLMSPSATLMSPSATLMSPSVSISDHESASDRDSEDKDREETKRLLYVALTRARDRLYLSVTKAGAKLTLQRGSLGRILPAGLMTAAAGVDAEILWQGHSTAHRIRRIPASGEVPRAWRPVLSMRERRVDLEPFEAQKTSKGTKAP